MPETNQSELLEMTQKHLDFFERNYINGTGNGNTNLGNESQKKEVKESENSTKSQDLASASNPAELKASQIVNRKPDRIENQTELSYLTSCQNMVAYGGYNRKTRRELKRRAKAKNMDDANFIASIMRQQLDKKQDKKANSDNVEVVGLQIDEEKLKEQEELGNI